MATNGCVHPPKFFKIVFDPQDHTLTIPTKFIQKHAQNLPTSIILKVGNGSSRWAVELICRNGKTWMEKGWQEFKEYYSLDVGHVLVFEYVEKSFFNVGIFDMSAMEIEDPSHARNNNNGDEKQNIESQSESVIVLDDDDDDDDDDGDDDSASKTERMSKRASLPKTVDTKTCLAYQKAKAFMSAKKSRQPFFISVMQPSYILMRFSLFVPRSFAKQNLPKEKHNNLILRDQKGKKWDVRCDIGTFKAYMYVGWKKFAQDNKLKVGDFCVFEVIKTAYKPEWNVIIFDMNGDQKQNIESESDSVVVLDEYNNGNGKSGRERRKRKIDDDDDYDYSAKKFSITKTCLAYQKAKAFMSDKKSRHPSHATNNNSDPKQNIESESESVIVLDDDDDSASKDEGMSKRASISKTVDTKTCLAYQMANNFMSNKKSPNPFFISVMQPSYISTRFSLNVPHSFAKENFPKEKHNNLILCDERGKKWAVRCNIAETAKACMGFGWKKFVQGNNLRVGDACVFEMTKTAKPKPEWNVIVFRS